MTERPAAPRASTVAHSIMPAPGEVEAVDDAWGDDEPATAPASAAALTIPTELEPPTLRLSDPLEFDIPKAGAVPVMFVPGASTAPSVEPVSSQPPPSDPQRPSGPPTMRITSRPPSSTPASRPSTSPGYGYRASQRPSLADEMKSRFAEGDFSGALVFAEALLTTEPSHEDANLYASSCRVGLSEAYLCELGGREGVPYLRVRGSELVAHDLDAAHGFLVAQVDGMATVDEIVDVCGKAEHETLRVLFDLLRREVIGVR